MIVVIILAALVAFSIIYLFAVAGASSSRSKIRGGSFGIIGGVIFITLIYGAIFLDHSIDNKLWNNGYCPTCGEAWVFRGGSAGYGAQGHEYYYSCDNCHSTIRIHSMR